MPDLPLEDSASLTDDVSSSEESVEQSGLGDEKVEDGKQPDSRRSRKKVRRIRCRRNSSLVGRMGCL